MRVKMLKLLKTKRVIYLAIIKYFKELVIKYFSLLILFKEVVFALINNKGWQHILKCANALYSYNLLLIIKLNKI